ncbi:MAG: hypothetical protein WD468_08930 [Pirellulales bacterium]
MILASVRSCALVSAALLCVLPGAVFADLNITSITPTKVIKFDGTGSGDAESGNGSYAGNGFNSTPTAGQLDSDTWAMNGTGAGGGMATLAFGDLRASGVYNKGSSTGGVSSNGFYAFNVGGGNVAFGVQPGSGTFNPGTLTLRVKNTTGSTLADWSVAYDIFAWNDGGRSTSIKFMYSTSDSTGIGANTLYTAVSALDYSSPEAFIGTGWSAATPKSTQIPVAVPNNGFLYLRWAFADVSGSGTYDEFALDNISVGVAAVPEPGAVLFGGLVIAMIGLAVGFRRPVNAARADRSFWKALFGPGEK